MRRIILGGVACVATAFLTLATAGTALAATGPVSTTPAKTPHLDVSVNNPNGTVQQVRQLVQCGGTMYAVGSISEIQNGTTVTTVHNAFSFSATAPYALTSWAPDIVGTNNNKGDGVVNSIAFNGSNCADAYIGGNFTSVNGTTVKNIAEVSTTTGNVVTTFGHTAGGQVSTLLGVNGHILAGGYYKTINSSTANPYMTSLNPVTGKDDGYLHLNISGNYQFPGVGSNPTRVYNQQLSHGGTLDLVEGDFTTAGGFPRQQIFMLNLATSPATVTGWTSPEWDGSQGEATPADPNTGYPYECAHNEPFYIQAAAWSPTDSTVYIGTTGYHPNNWPTGQTPRNGLCDAAAAFPATVNPPPVNGQPGFVLHTWVNYPGCDSLYSTAADASTAYFGGHERWIDNGNDCDQLGPGGISAPGMVGLNPATGAVNFNPTRARGLGADDMLVTSAGLWIASDNQGHASQCAGKDGHSGICFLPYS